ncbi:MAG: hypothetical protein QW372_06845 [Nitrososphaerales archaeon]
MNSIKILAILSFLLGIATLYVIILDDPWWILIGGEYSNPILRIAISPYTSHIEILGRLVRIEILTLINNAIRLSMIILTMGMILGSILLLRGFKNAIKMIGFELFILTIGILVAIYLSNSIIAQYIQQNFGITDFTYPVLGSVISKISISLGSFVAVFNIPLQAQLTSTFYLALGLGLISLVIQLIGRVLLKTKS